jgi:predicted nucleic acid-binding protein
LIWRRERSHERVRAHYRRLVEAGDTLVTLNLVVAETATRLRYDAGLRVALEFRTILEAAARVGRLGIRYADEELDGKAWAVMERYADLALSFADCAGAVAAREARAQAVFGLDRDFTALGFALEP